MTISVLIPWRTDNGPREKVWNYLKPRWETTGVDLCVGSDDDTGPFNFAKLANDAFKNAQTDKLLIFGADGIPDLAMLEAVEDGLYFSPWLRVCSQTGYYSKDTTNQILVGADLEAAPLEYTLPFSMGVIACTRDSYVAAGGMDERFRGWGFEDTAFLQTLGNLFGARSPLPYMYRCLWHETDHRIAVSPNSVLMEEYTALKDRESTLSYLAQRGSFVDGVPPKA